MKKCNGKCGSIKELSEFNVDKSTKDGLNSKCKLCIREKHKQYYKLNPQKHYKYKRSKEIKKNYGITLENFEQMLVKQSNLCLICNQPETDPHKNVLSIDHCHKTGKVRGLLCNSCNRGLGLFKENPSILQKATNYLLDNYENK